MEFKKFEIAGPVLLTLKMNGDHRGFFCERYRVDQFERLGKELNVQFDFIQDNYSRSSYGTLRGLHYQWDKPQGKLVTCTRGRVLDVVVDIRSQSKSFGQFLSIELNGDKPEWLWVPAGFAHGFVVLSEEGADLMYKVNNYWNSQGEGAIHWQDPDLSIPWPIQNPSLSQKDQQAPSFAQYKQNPKF